MDGSVPAGNFSGQGLLVWNFAGATHVPVSFSNLQVVKAFNSATGGCATGGQMTSGSADAALVSQLQTIVDQVSPTGPTSFSGTLGEALVALNQTMKNPNPDKTAVGQLTSAILQGLSQWKEAIQTTYGSTRSADLKPVLEEIDGLITAVNQANQCAQLSTCVLDQTLLQTTLSTRIFVANQQLTDLANLPTDPKARIAAQENCQLDVSHFDATNLAILPINVHLLMAHGCVGGSITWSNGTPANGAPNGTTLTWANGETDQLLGGVFSDRALVVKPNTQTTYTAICQMPTGKNCTQSIPITVSSPDCPPFTITASATTFERGQTITLTASGCSGNVSWANDLGSGNQLTVMPATDFIASATCYQPNLTCFSNAIAIQLVPTCIQSMYVQQEKVIDPGIGNTKRERTLAVLGCETGYLTWQKKGQADASVNGRTFVMTDIKGPISVTVTCTLSGQPPCPPVSQIFPEPIPECTTLLLLTSRDDATTPPPGYTNLYSTFKKPFVLTDPTGKHYNASPGDVVSVPVLAKDQVYTAQFDNGCTASKLVPALSYTTTWLNYNNGSPRTLTDPLSRTNDPVAYTADVDAPDIQLKLKSACAGKVTWRSSAEPTLRLEASELILTHSYSTLTPRSTLFPNSDSSRVQSLYVPFPLVTTTYQASCQVTSGGTTTVFPATNAKTIVVVSNSCLKLTASAKTLTQGEALTLQAVGCSGTVKWSTDGNVVGIGTTITHTPVLATTPGSVVYTAQCDNPNCSESVTVQLKPTQLAVTASKTTVAIAEAVSLTASGCSGGLVVWSTGETGPILTVQPLEQTTYTATCLINGVSLSQKSVTLSVINTAPDPIECPPFSLAANSATVVRCAEQTITFSPKGCPVGSIVTWSDGHVGAYNEPYALVVNTTLTMTATCKTPYGIEAVASLRIEAVPPTLSVSPGEVYAGFPATLRASGCSTDNCQPGSYTWTNKTSGQTYSGASITITLTQSTTFVVSCSNGQSAQVNVNIKTNDENKCTLPSGILVNASRNISPTTYFVNASWCDVTYAISWRKTGVDHKTVDYPSARNKRSFTVTRPPMGQIYDSNGQPFGKPFPQYETYTVACVRNGTPCVFTAGNVASYDPTFPDLGGYDTKDATESPLSPPDPCKELSFVEKGGFKNVTRNAGMSKRPRLPMCCTPTGVPVAKWSGQRPVANNC
ncbi:hypothetical protein [Larkinella rosea]|uniref:Uncharacterized protein n=1 Tax=Larkinella rosea TaxID=2025312 RepID=A0A3P1BQ81_9BACT|nr:hypothetical protein [Larkinella rosea]RRB02834.1 hypothetical protein EHT25_20565 [Larkinella rosea]